MIKSSNGLGEDSPEFFWSCDSERWARHSAGMSWYTLVTECVSFQSLPVQDTEPEGNFWIRALPVGGRFLCPSLFLFLNVLKLPLAWHSGESSLKAPEISDASVPQGLLVEVLWGLNAENEIIQLLMTHAGRFLTLLNSKWILFCWLHTFLLSQPSLSFPFLSSSHQHLSSFVSSLQSSSSPLSCSSVSPLPLYP